jgi:uncharacterized oligopeptide transporter (OPT) family protein
MALRIYWFGSENEIASITEPELHVATFRFYFDFSPTYVGVGMICPHIVNVSVLLGGILSWGIMWPLIRNKKGSWYSASLLESSLHGLQGYRVNIDTIIHLLFHCQLYSLLATKQLIC